MANTVDDPANPMAVPPGLMTRIAEYAYASAHIPNWEIARFTAILFMAAISGRAYNTYTGAGLNLYMIMLAGTGSGKDHIAKTISTLFNAIQAKVPASAGFRGPGHIASAPGLVRWLDKNPVVLCVLSEISKRLPEWNNPRNPNGIAIQRTLLELYSKSGSGNTFDPSAYSDREKNTGSIKSPSLTIGAEGVPDEFYRSLDDGLISGGLAPRFIFFEYEGERAYSNADAGAAQLDCYLIQNLTDYLAYSLGVSQTGQPHIVPVDGRARDYLQQFDDELTDEMNANSEVAKQLWNRGHLNALKLASLSAISINHLNPVVTYHDALWGVSIIRRQVERLIVKFQKGEVGSVEGNESKQHTEVLRIIRHYVTSRWEQVAMYHGTADMHRDGVITKAHITQRLANTAAFKGDREKPSAAIKRVLDQLLGSDELRQMPHTQMLAKYGKHPEAYVVSDFTRLKEL